jgi:apolipoprotein N-acyltransferase
VIMISSVDWGLVVPIALTLAGVALYGLPLALWCNWASRRMHGWALFIATAAAWSLCMDLGDLVGFPSKCESLSAVAFAPVLLGGCRLFGSNVACGIIVAGTLSCGARLARSGARDAHAAADALAPLGASLTLLLVASGVAHWSAGAPTASVIVGVPQLNVPSDYFKLRQAVPQQTDRLEALFSEQLGELGDVDLLALTETYDGTFPLQVPRLRARFQNYARLQHQAVLLTSYLVGKAGGGLNAVGGINANGELVGVHRKVNLAPFGEVELERGAGFHALRLLPNVKVGSLICQEALLSEGPRALTRDGANLLVTTTSDISFGSGILSFGHLAAARLRAIEVGRSMVWASNGGASGIISRWGEFQPTAPFRRPAAARMSAALFQDTSLFLRTSWLWPPLCACLVVFLGWRNRSRVERGQAEERRTSSVRGVLEFAVSLALAAVAAIASPAMVEVMRGEPALAQRAILELFGRAAPELGPASLARFHTDDEHSAQGALAFYLDFYGDRRLPSSFISLRANPTLLDLSRELSEGASFPTREIQLNFNALPRASALVRMKSGMFGVLTSNSLNVVGLFISTQNSQTELNYEQARSLLEPTALLPAIDPRLD